MLHWWQWALPVASYLLIGLWSAMRECRRCPGSQWNGDAQLWFWLWPLTLACEAVALIVPLACRVIRTLARALALLLPSWSEAEHAFLAAGLLCAGLAAWLFLG